MPDDGVCDPEAVLCRREDVKMELVQRLGLGKIPSRAVTTKMLEREALKHQRRAIWRILRQLPTDMRRQFALQLIESSTREMIVLPGSKKHH